MNSNAAQFALDPRLTYLNHASYGAPSLAGLDHADLERRYLERDTAPRLGGELLDRLRTGAQAVAARLGAEPGSVALVANTTEGAAALASSVPLGAGDRVLMLDVEYSSVIRAWQVRCAAVGAHLDLVHLPLPATEESVLRLLRGADPRVRVAVISAITSSTALRLPLARVADWARTAGVELLVDGAHAMGHLELDVSAVPCGAVFGSLHKWLPVPRSVGFLWLAPHLRDLVRPAAISLYWDADDLVERFGWRGTWDPAPALGLGRAWAEHQQWSESGHLLRAAALASEAGDVLGELGLVPTCDGALLAPRLRAFACPDLALADLDAALLRDGVRAWTGLSAAGQTLLRVSTHVYNDGDDLRALAHAVSIARPAR
ncbi:aminotransferase class V-fold PLP-dependent enzyme [Pengzhenrongella frigida]|uniref:Aminotransferase class V-fold PLP-dependent enzyme n=1 Tax=Pengzhenrongella frigida TaxID=1259133 RepID=A0A4V1ZHJ8_9MICO|nr:aminotransferase class V-fold PLP-dependent enzyme [Cellulomonas sp. HLT2-17]RYV52294.1 aminotransferase class V-fold PLP-dependent enzyme [Cellulomonas sp. HLT2-17]